MSHTRWRDSWWVGIELVVCASVSFALPLALFYAPGSVSFGS